MTNENPRGLPVAWLDAADLSERECFEVLACSDKYKGVTQHELRYNTPLVLATDYAALLAERDAAERIGLELQGRAQRAESLLRESRRWLGDGVNSDGLAREHWTPAYASIIDRIDAAISAMEGGAS